MPERLVLPRWQAKASVGICAKPSTRGEIAAGVLRCEKLLEAELYSALGERLKGEEFPLESPENM